MPIIVLFSVPKALTFHLHDILKVNMKTRRDSTSRWNPVTAFFARKKARCKTAAAILNAQ
jgi:hypothetical protein